MSKILNFDSMISNYEIINPEFARVKVYVCYAGRNRNRSSIDEQTLNKMAKTIYGIPMVAEYDEENNCFKGHGGKIEITDEGIDFIQTTVPYGFVDPTTPVFYEEVTGLDGITKHNYLCCYAYLWYKRYPEVESVLRNQDNKKIGQSMEIQVDSYEIDEDGYCVIKDGCFEALAMLGVEPCFESASVTSKFSQKDNSIWEDMINTFKKYCVEGGENMNEEDYKKKKCEDEDEDYKKKKCEDDEDDEDFKKKKCSEDEEEDNQEDYKKKKCEDDDTEDDEEDYKKKKCEDEDDEEFKKKKCSEEEYEQQIMTLKADYSDLLAEYEALKEKYSALESEVSELREYKKSKEDFEKDAELEANVFSKFEALKKVEGYEDIYNKRFELSEDELNLRLKALAFDNGIVIKKSKTFSAKPEKKILPIDNVKKEKNPSEWDLILKK